MRLLALRRAHVEDLFLQLRRLPRIEVVERVLNVKGVEGREEKLKRLRGARRAGESLDGGTLATVRTALGSALDRARKTSLIAVNPVRDATVVRSAPKRRKFLDAAELDHFLREAAQDRYATFWTLAVQSGARLGELLGLRWGCTDFRRGVIRIERQWRAESRKLTDPKSRHPFARSHSRPRLWRRFGRIARRLEPSRIPRCSCSPPRPGSRRIPRRSPATI